MWSALLRKVDIFLYKYFPAHSIFSLGMETLVYRFASVITQGSLKGLWNLEIRSIKYQLFLKYSDD